MNLQIFLDLTYNPGKISKFFLFLPITRAKFLDFTYYLGGHMYTWSPLGVAPLV